MVFRSNSSLCPLTLVLVGCLCLLVQQVEGRVWQTIVDHNIVRRSTVESLRYSIPIESDPFFFPEDIAVEEDDEEDVVDSV